MSLLGGLSVVISIISVFAGVVYWIHHLVSNGVVNDERSAALQSEVARVAQQERAADVERAARTERFNAKAAAVHTADDAARLLREVSDDPGTN